MEPPKNWCFVDVSFFSKDAFSASMGMFSCLLLWVIHPTRCPGVGGIQVTGIDKRLKILPLVFLVTPLLSSKIYPSHFSMVLTA